MTTIISDLPRHKKTHSMPKRVPVPFGYVVNCEFFLKLEYGVPVVVHSFSWAAVLVANAPPHRTSVSLLRA
eukprot:scaffold456726_cov19-Prasinocladus_malaysianus.AAC.1